MKKIICVGHAALDYVYRIEAFPPQPMKVRSLEHIESGGGMAANASAAIARLGGDVELWSRVGGDSAGERILKFLAGDGVDISHVRTFPHARSSTSAVIVDQTGERMIVGERDHAMPLDADWLPLQRIMAAEVGVVMSDLRWLEGTLAAFKQARAQGVPTLIDADLGSSGLMEEFLPLTDYAIFSAPALDAFAGAGDGAAHNRSQLAKVLEHGVRYAGVTRGAGGYVWLTADGQTGEQAAFALDAVDTTGAGDAFHGAFAWALASGALASGEPGGGANLAECARVASAVAALKCRRLGARAGLPTQAELDEFLHARAN